MTVISPSNPHVYWPSWRYGPNGEAQIFQKAADVPEGWKDHPRKHLPDYKPEDDYSPSAGVIKPVEPEKTYPMSRDEMCAGLFQRHIPFDEDAKTETLWALVQAAQAIATEAERAAQQLLDEADKSAA